MNLYAIQNPDPSKTLRFEIEPLKEFEEIKPSNLKGAEAAAATCAYLNPNSAIAITAQSTTFGIGTPTLATLQQQVETNNNLEAGGHFQQNNSLEAEVVQPAGEEWPFSVVALRVKMTFRSSTTTTTVVLCGPS